MLIIFYAMTLCNNVCTRLFACCVEVLDIYRIMQIVRGGKVSRLHDHLVICGKTFAIVQQFETPYNKKKKIRWKTFTIGVKTAKVFHRE